MTSQEHKPVVLDSAEAEVIRVEGELPALMLRGDVAAIANLTADDFIGYDPRGHEVNKADILARRTNPDMTVESLVHEQIRVRVFWGHCRGHCNQCGERALQRPGDGWSISLHPCVD